MDKAKDVAGEAIEKSLAGGFKDWNELKNDTREAIRRFIFEKTRRSPVILPLFLDV